MSATFEHSYCLKLSLPLLSVDSCSFGSLTTSMYIPSYWSIAQPLSAFVFIEDNHKTISIYTESSTSFMI
jgi:hypothetical protein